MKKIYTLKSAISRNSTGLKYNVIAAPASVVELEQNKKHFEFDFTTLVAEYIVYKIIAADNQKMIQGLVAFRPSPGVLECANMEINVINKHGKALYSGVGKCMVALCCKFSMDNGMDGYIAFDAKSRLAPYYRRLGAFSISGIRMAIDTNGAQKLIDLYL